MSEITSFITTHVEFAPYMIFGLLLLVGLNIPVSIDVMVVIAAVLASRIAPHLTYHFYFAMFFGCIFSAWISFSLGRILGNNVEKIPFISHERLEKVHNFYKKYGLFTMLIGRFIPFGIRNVLFLSSGMSGRPFRQFALHDGIAVLLWTSTVFPALYYVGGSFETVVALVKQANVIIFSVFTMAVIAIIWYKKRNRKTAATE